MNAPKYSPSDKVYLRESAALGFLEPVHVTSVLSTPNGWLYSYSQEPKPNYAGVYGERRSLVNGATIWLDESEMVDYCTALNLAKAVVQARMTELNNLIAACS